MPVEDIKKNPKNWRLHPEYQQVALSGVLETVGWVQELIVNEVTGNLIDGHLRYELAKKHKEKEVPVKYVKLTPEEEDIVLATLDPIAEMADADQKALNSLIDGIQTENEGIVYTLDKLHKEVEDKTEEVLLKRSVQLLPEQEYVMIVCKTNEDFDAIRAYLGLGMVRRGGYKEGSAFNDAGAERLITAEKFMERVNANRDTK
jgi:hypothetical protein